MRPDVLLATGAEWPDLHPDEEPLIEELRRRGASVLPAVWTDPTVDWAGARLVVVRAVFDYTRAREEFCDWADRVSSQTSLHNPAAVLQWNSHKYYLRDLSSDGVPVVPTSWAAAGSGVDLVDLMHERGWPDVVVKAAVDNGARAAMRVTSGEIVRGQAHVDALLPSRDLMIQPYVNATEEIGEHALVFIDGAFSHAVRKDQMLAGRSFSIDRVLRVEPEAAELELAERVLKRFPDPLLYARVDVISTGDEVLLMELEVLEPVRGAVLFLAIAAPWYLAGELGAGGGGGAAGGGPAAASVAAAMAANIDPSMSVRGRRRLWERVRHDNVRPCFSGS